MSALGDRLKELRVERGLSQTQMGKLFGWRQNEYQRVEAGGSRHRDDKLKMVDEVMIRQGFPWHKGLAGELQNGLTTDPAVLERLDRLLEVQEGIAAQLERFGSSTAALSAIRRLLAEQDLDGA